MPGAAAEFYRGPHDGLVLTIHQIRRYCHLVTMRNEDVERVFAMMPSPREWDRVVRGDRDNDGPFGTLYRYELEPWDGGAAFLYRRHTEFGQAFEEDERRP
jgi:hypothetical protein